jgi:hypothetical protein
LFKFRVATSQDQTAVAKYNPQIKKAHMVSKVSVVVSPRKRTPSANAAKLVSTRRDLNNNKPRMHGQQKEKLYAKDKDRYFCFLFFNVDLHSTT